MINYTINLNDVKTLWELHQALKDGLGLPEYYGMNMDALWDCITSGDIEFPATIYIQGFNNLPKDLSEKKDTLKTLLKDAIHWCDEIGIELNVVFEE